MQSIKNRFFTGRRPESDPAPHFAPTGRIAPSSQGAEGSRSLNLGSGQGTATRSHAFSNQSVLARSDDVSTSSPIGREMQAAVRSEQNSTPIELTPNVIEALGSLELKYHE